MPHAVSRLLLFVLAVFVAFTTLFGAWLVVPDLPPEWIEGSIFADYTIPAIALGFVGILAIIAALTLLIRPEVAGLPSILTGAAMVTFELVEIAVVGLSIIDHGVDEPVAWLQIVYIAIGLLQIAFGFALWRATAPDRERWLRTGHHLIGSRP
jgi:hypothetical protein